MSCWVVPQVAADLWGVPLESILDAARSGAVASKVENGFTFVDVAPQNAGCRMPREMRPNTFALVTPEEAAALLDDEPPAELVMQVDDQPAATLTIEDWRAARKSTARKRRPPASVA